MKTFSNIINEWKYSTDKNIDTNKLLLFLSKHKWSFVDRDSATTNHPRYVDPSFSPRETGIMSELTTWKSLNTIIITNGKQESEKVIEYVSLKSKFLSSNKPPTIKVVATKFVFNNTAYYIVKYPHSADNGQVFIFARDKLDKESPLAAYSPTIDKYDYTELNYITVKDAETIEKFINRYIK